MPTAGRTQRPPKDCSLPRVIMAHRLISHMTYRCLIFTHAASSFASISRFASHMPHCAGLFAKFLAPPDDNNTLIWLIYRRRAACQVPLAGHHLLAISFPKRACRRDASGRHSVADMPRRRHSRAWHTRLSPRLPLARRRALITTRYLPAPLPISVAGIAFLGTTLSLYHAQ